MRIAFRIDFGIDIGMGHLTRMTALADAFSEFGCESVFFSTADEPIDFIGFDIIVVDSYKLTDEYIARLNQTGAFILCYDDNALYEYSCDVLLNANLHAQDLVFRFGEQQPKLLLGGDYALLRREFWISEPIRIRNIAHRVFLCFGGADIRSITPSVLSAIQDIPDVEIVAVLGSATSCDEKVRAVAKSNVDIIKDPASMMSIMQSCDIAIVSSSSMIYELAALGIPALVITQADNQELIAAYLERHKLMKYIGKWDGFDRAGLAEETKILLRDKDRRNAESERLKRTVNAKGAMVAAEEILGLANETIG